jgi:DASS family divalent anion:Na+ symporter
MARRKRLLLVVGWVVLVWVLPRPAELSPQAWRLLAIFSGTIVGLVLQAAASGAVVLFGLVAAILTGAMSASSVLAGFSNASVWLIVSAFLFSHAVSSTGLGRRVAYLFIRSFGRRTLGLGYALAASELVIAPAVPSNTARAGGILFPIVESIARACGSDPRTSPRRLGAYLMLNQFQADTILSAMFLTSMASNPLIAELAATTAGVRLGWGTWAAAASLPGLVSLAVVPWILYRTYPPERAESPEAPAEAHRLLAEMGPLRRSEILLAVIVGGCLALWTTTSLHHLDPTTIALLGLAVMLLSGVLAWRDVTRCSGAWDAFLWFGGLIGMADALGKLGMDPAAAGVGLFLRALRLRQHDGPCHRHVRPVSGGGGGRRRAPAAGRVRAGRLLEPQRLHHALLDGPGAHLFRSGVCGPGRLVEARPHGLGGQPGHLDRRGPAVVETDRGVVDRLSS